MRSSRPWSLIAALSCETLESSK
ncbi:UNVERIFIED_CONTAM: hypothetical protein GTU68_046184 [Idotea baltica]|nr:hypothetical protein [Idotea baltica]